MIAVIRAAAERDRGLVQGADPGQVDLRQVAQGLARFAELHQVDAIDLHVARGDVAEAQLDFRRRAGLERRAVWQPDPLADEIGDRRFRVGDAVLHAAVFAYGLGPLAKALVDLAEDVDRPVLVGAIDHAARLLVEMLGLGHLAAHLDRRGVLARGEVAVGQNIPVGVQQFALRIAAGIGDHGLGRVGVPLQIELGVGRGESGLVGGRISRVAGQKGLELLPCAADEGFAIELRLVRLGKR